ncbi:MAG: hypothetical protein JO264_12615 [Acidisphaera sp.]|nr:hypothetical protein [Acidisphaera sp.]
MPRTLVRAVALLPLLAGCGVQDSRVAHRAQTNLLGMSTEDLQACVGAPDKRTKIGDDEILTYFASSNSAGGIDLTLPIVGGINFSGGGYCHATFKLVGGHVTELRYTGDNSELLGPQGVCAPIVRDCLNHPEPLQSAPAR